MAPIADIPFQGVNSMFRSFLRYWTSKEAIDLMIITLNLVLTFIFAVILVSGDRTLL